MTNQLQEFNENINHINISSVLQEYNFNDLAFEKLLSVINDDTAFINKLFELAGFKIEDGYDGLMYSTLLEAFIVDAEINPRIVELPKELLTVRFADRIKESIKIYTPEYYDFTNQINYYDYRLLPILTDGCKNPRELIESVFRNKAINLITEFIDNVSPEFNSVVEELDDEIIAFIIPSILEYNRTTIADKEVVMSMIVNPEALFTLRTDNREMSDIIVQTLLEQIDNKRNEATVSKLEEDT